MARHGDSPVFGKRLKPPNHTPTPDNRFDGRGDFLYRNGKQIGLDWDGLKARQDARLAEEATRRADAPEVTREEAKKKLLRKKTT